MNYLEYLEDIIPLQKEYLGEEKPVNNNLPVVSVHVITYQHAPYIAQCLDSILAQQTAFAYEIVIGEDASTDGTRAICMDYAVRYPDKIRLFLRDRKETVLQKGKRTVYLNGKLTYKACRGKYIAICEGDDYWADPLKLQKQVDFLDTNKDYVVAYHDAVCVDSSGKMLKESKLDGHPFKCDASPTDLKKGHWVLTLTSCFRNVLKEMPPEYLEVFNGDRFLFSYLGRFGRGKYMSDVGKAGYRIHPGGVWSLKSGLNREFLAVRTNIFLSKFYRRVEDEEMALYYDGVVKASAQKIFGMARNQQRISDFFKAYRLFFVKKRAYLSLPMFYYLNKVTVEYFMKKSVMGFRGKIGR